MSYQRFSLQASAAQTAASAASAAGHTPKLSFFDAGETDGTSHGSAATAATAARGELKTNFLRSDDVLIMFERVVAQFMLTDMPRPDAERRALPVLKGMLHNDPRLAPRQVEAWRCLICGEPGSEGNRLLPYLSAVRGHHHWMHQGNCHEIHCRNQSGKVDACLRAAGL